MPFTTESLGLVRSVVVDQGSYYKYRYCDSSFCPTKLHVGSMAWHRKRGDYGNYYCDPCVANLVRGAVVADKPLAVKREEDQEEIARQREQARQHKKLQKMYEKLFGGEDG